MKRREVLQTAATSVIAALSVSTFSSYAAKNTAVAGKAVGPSDLPSGDAPILTPENVWAMPNEFWQNFSGKLWIGKAGSDPTQAGNQIPLFLRDSKGQLTELTQPVTLNRETLTRFVNNDAALIANPAHSMAVVEENGQTLFNIPDVTRAGAYSFSQRIAEPGGYQLIGEIPSAAVLRNTTPLFEGAKVKLKSWHEGREVGGGEFVGSLKPAQDDGGVILTGKTFHWRRVVEDYNRLTVFDFGAIADGQTDAADAVRAMYLWTQNNNEQISIQFPAGRFFVSKFDALEKYTRFFRLTGAPVNFGYFPTTTLVSDGKAEFVFGVKARWVEIANISFEGGNDKRPNLQGFFLNNCPAGQFFRASCLRFSQVGGVSLSLMDTLDCKIDQWYASHCSGDVIKGVWSDTKKGNWDHNTAVELSNFNAQGCDGVVINLPRCSQSFIHNGWIEHSPNPGNISDGQWIIDGLSMEGCKNALNARNSRLNLRQINLQVGSRIDNANAPGSWLSSFELGSTRIESFGAAIDGSLKYGYVTAKHRLENKSSTEQWVELGRFYSPEAGDSWEIEIPGDQGKAVIHLQRLAHKSTASWHSEGGSPITDVAFYAPYDTDVILCVKMASEVSSAMVLLKTTGKDRYLTGKCARFDATLKPLKSAPGQGSHKAETRFSLQSGKVAIGGTNDGDLLLSANAITAERVDASSPAGYVSVLINGEHCALPYFKTK
ncbi:phage tailspike protein [Erwinia sp. BNK-24-b]|uniref:phage tailspike protein n=1 Tax=unclassified Erwinia TaxID=2622719 RepID=UPI0039BFCC3E